MSKQRVLLVHSGNGDIESALSDDFSVHKTDDTLMAVNEIGMRDYDAVVVNREVEHDNVVSKLCAILNGMGVPTILIEEGGRRRLRVRDKKTFRRTDTLHLAEVLKQA